MTAAEQQADQAAVEVVTGELSRSWSTMSLASSVIDACGRKVLGPGRIACSIRRLGSAIAAVLYPNAQPRFW